LSPHPRRLHGASQRGQWAELATPSDLKVTFKLETYVERVQPEPGSPTSELALSKLRRLGQCTPPVFIWDPQPLSLSPGNHGKVQEGGLPTHSAIGVGPNGVVYPLFWRGGISRRRSQITARSSDVAGDPQLNTAPRPRQHRPGRSPSVDDPRLVRVRGAALAVLVACLQNEHTNPRRRADGG
jgi:hypothetical protein